MDDSFSTLGFNQRHFCGEAEERGRELTVRHFVFDDLLDSGETLTCRALNLGSSFRIFNYILIRESASVFQRKEHRSLGCCIAYTEGNPFTFEDFNFKLRSFDDFSLLVEAVEVSSGNNFFFELCNVCELPERITQEQEVLLTLYAKSLRKLPLPAHFDQVADENREVLKLALKGNEKATEKLQRELGEEEVARLISELKSHPEELFDTCMLYSQGAYSIIGIVTACNRFSVAGREFLTVDAITEDVCIKALCSFPVDVEDGDRIEVTGKMYGLALL